MILLIAVQLLITGSFTSTVGCKATAKTGEA
jgi:hypothetical protein